MLDSKALAIHFAHFLYIKAHYVVHSSLEEKSIPEAKVTSVNLIMIMEIFLLVLAFTGISIKCEGNTKLVFFFTLFFRNTKNYRLLHVQSSHWNTKNILKNHLPLHFLLFVSSYFQPQANPRKILVCYVYTNPSGHLKN